MNLQLKRNIAEIALKKKFEHSLSIILQTSSRGSLFNLDIRELIEDLDIKVLPECS